MLGPWEGSKTEGKLGFPQAEKGPLGKTEMSAQTRMHTSLSTTQGSYQGQ